MEVDLLDCRPLVLIDALCKEVRNGADGRGGGEEEEGVGFANEHGLGFNTTTVFCERQAEEEATRT